MRRRPPTPRTFPARNRARRAAAVVLAVAALIAVADPALARREKSVFLTQPADWEPQVGKDDKVPSLTFVPSWTWTGFTAPLAGDPVACAGSIVAAGRDGAVVALDPAGGDPVWRIALDAPLPFGPASDGTRLFAATAAGGLRALSGSDGRTLWSVNLPAGPVVPPRVVGSRVLVATTDGALTSVDRASGEVAGRVLLPGRASTTPEPAPGAVLIGTDHGSILSFDAADLGVRFRRDYLGVITSPPVFEDDRIWVAVSDRTVRCLKSKSGREVWSAHTGSECTARPMIHGPYLYVLCFDNDIYVFGKRNGHQLTRVRMDHRLETDAIFAADHMLVVPSTESSVVGLSLPGLRRAGRFDLKAPGEWFTTAPLWTADHLAVGFGRNEGRVVSLRVSEQPPAATAPPPPETAPAPGSSAAPSAAPSPMATATPAPR